MTRPKILIVDDESAVSESLARGLVAQRVDADFYFAQTIEQAESTLTQHYPEVAIIDLSLNPAEGVESGYRLLKTIIRIQPDTRIIVLTGNSGIEFGVRALKEGAAHFLAKPADLSHLTALIRDSVFQSQARSSLTQFRQERESELTQSIIGSSQQAQKLRQEIKEVAQTTQSVFIRGETGTGKGLCAKVIHQLSPRRQFPFVRYQPLFASSDLVNSDLFGHKKGAFTGATDNRSGLLEHVQKGTLFLDEIDELPRETQVMLLGVLQERRFRCLGESNEREANFRLISASNAEIEKKIEESEFRRDLYHRMNHVEITITPLRERREDIPELAQHILKNLSHREALSPISISSSALDILATHHWPGNIRELENVVEGAAWRVLQRQAVEIHVEDIRLQGQAKNNHQTNATFHEQVHAFEKELVERALRQHNNSISATARSLGLDRGTVKRITER